MQYESESPKGSIFQPNNSTDTANALVVDAWLEAALDSSGDIDVFSIYAESAGLIRLNFGNSLTTATPIWRIDLLNYDGDYLSVLGANNFGTPMVSGTANSGKSLLVSGLSSAVSIGSRFTFSTTEADSVIYTVVDASRPSGGQSTLTLDKSLTATPTEETPLVFAPTQISVAGLTGGNTSLTTSVSAAGNYFFKVSAENWQSDSYLLKASFVATTETLLNDTKVLAVQEGNRLQANAWMTGALTTPTDVDTWVFTTAAASDFSIDFSASSGNDNSPAWEISLSQWSGAPLTTLQGVILGGSVGSSGSYSIDNERYSSGGTFVVSVKAATGTYDSGAYTLRLRGDSLDLNDTPIMTVGSVSSGVANQPVQTAESNSLEVSIASKISRLALKDLFTISDADVIAGTQTLSYKVWLSTVQNQTATGQIQIEGEPTAYSNGSLMSASQMAKAFLVAGTDEGDLSLGIQAFDSSWTADSDNSGSSALMYQTIKLVGASNSNLVNLSGSVRFWKNNDIKLDDVLITAPEQNPVVSGEKVTGGFTINNLSAEAATPIALNAAKSITVTEPSQAGINLSDVLGALKVYLDKDKSSPFKYIASDFDGNGKVELTDVLSLLKFYLKKPNAPVQPSWTFIDAADVSESGISGPIAGLISKSATQAHAIDVDLSSTSTVELVGVLRGDVDGSWTPPSS
jgi:hypothetical protein